jgi:hypothetical protein
LDLQEIFRSAKTDSSNPGSSDQVVEWKEGAAVAAFSSEIVLLLQHQNPSP